MHTAFRIALLQLSIVNRRKACHSHTSLESTAAYMISIQPLNVAYVERVFSEYQHVKLNALIHYGFALNYLCVLWCKKRKGHENIFTVCKYALTDAYIFLMSQSCGSFFNVTLLSSEFQFFFFYSISSLFPRQKIKQNLIPHDTGMAVYGCMCIIHCIIDWTLQVMAKLTICSRER